MIKPTIDAHVHLNTPSRGKMEKAVDEGVSFLSINTDIPFFPSLSDQKRVALQLAEEYPGRVRFITSFSVEGWEDEHWETKALNEIKKGLDDGAAGVKIWKNIGMDLKDQHGDFVMIDHPKFDSIFQYLEDNGILVIGHLGEPKNCWLPLDEMTVDSDREYFSKHPQYHMHLHPNYPTYEKQIFARDQRLKKHKNLKFVGLHLASLEWNVDAVSNWLDTFPNTMTDLAERICHLQYQATIDHKKVKSFIMNHQDRLIYGTDVIDDGSLSESEIQRKFENLWQSHWDFFSSGKTLSAPEFKDSFNGLELEKSILEKIFHTNAQKTYGFQPLTT
ncbi:amidohydrolase family protein [Litoribacter ruber]|uniref:amidohydrolase family protein n=1 Tax=Litoribacter ruber TaxID=702568 RepID=UPI001BDB6280|nr:amidohydrolase family protein [Litoribacter ruber]MBT0812874.1 amidohydrolase family protein [Litoribacter ruber]